MMKCGQPVQRPTWQLPYYAVPKLINDREGWTTVPLRALHCALHYGLAPLARMRLVNRNSRAHGQEGITGGAQTPQQLATRGCNSV